MSLEAAPNPFAEGNDSGLSFMKRLQTLRQAYDNRGSLRIDPQAIRRDALTLLEEISPSTIQTPHNALLVLKNVNGLCPHLPLPWVMHLDSVLSSHVLWRLDAAVLAKGCFDVARLSHIASRALLKRMTEVAKGFPPESLSVQDMTNIVYGLSRVEQIALVESKTAQMFRSSRQLLEYRAKQYGIPFLDYIKPEVTDAILLLEAFANALWIVESFLCTLIDVIVTGTKTLKIHNVVKIVRYAATLFVKWRPLSPLLLDLQGDLRKVPGDEVVSFTQVVAALSCESEAEHAEKVSVVDKLLGDFTKVTSMRRAMSHYKLSEGEAARKVLSLDGGLQILDLLARDLIGSGFKIRTYVVSHVCRLLHHRLDEMNPLQSAAALFNSASLLRHLSGDPKNHAVVLKMAKALESRFDKNPGLLDVHTVKGSIRFDVTVAKDLLATDVEGNPDRTRQDQTDC